MHINPAPPRPTLQCPLDSVFLQDIAFARARARARLRSVFSSSHAALRGGSSTNRAQINVCVIHVSVTLVVVHVETKSATLLPILKTLPRIRAFQVIFS